MNPIVAESALRILVKRCQVPGTVGTQSRALAEKLRDLINKQQPCSAAA